MALELDRDQVNQRLLEESFSYCSRTTGERLARIEQDILNLKEGFRILPQMRDQIVELNGVIKHITDGLNGISGRTVEIEHEGRDYRNAVRDLSMLKDQLDGTATQDGLRRTVAALEAESLRRAGELKAQLDAQQKKNTRASLMLGTLSGILSAIGTSIALATFFHTAGH
jgi:hypothetical protein